MRARASDSPKQPSTRWRSHEGRDRGRHRRVRPRACEASTSRSGRGARRLEGCRACAGPPRSCGVTGGRNEDIVAGAELVVLAVKSEATLTTAAELAAAIGKTPVLCVASDLRFTPAGVLPGRHQGSLAEEVARVVSGSRCIRTAVVRRGQPRRRRPGRRTHLRRGRSREGAVARARRPSSRARRRLRAARELACARRHDRGHPQREQALQGARRHQVHGPALSRELRIIPVTGLPGDRGGGRPRRPDLGEGRARRRRRRRPRAEDRVEGRGPRSCSSPTSCRQRRRSRLPATETRVASRSSSGRQRASSASAAARNRRDDPRLHRRIGRGRHVERARAGHAGAAAPSIRMPPLRSFASASASSPARRSAC